LLAIGEAFAMAKQAGVPFDRLYEALRTCTADSWVLRSLESAILKGEYPPATFLGLKDLTAAVESGRSVHQAMSITGLAREMYQLIDAKLGGLHGSNGVLRYYLEA
jgi:3-hydroxyisobutyrate dehydrogenase-like beta-hydroxyacid dehydrogenase